MLNNQLRGAGTLTIGQETFTVKMNMNAFRLLTTDFGVQLEAIDDFINTNQLDAICALAYCGIKAGEASQGKKFDMDYDIFCGMFLDDEEGMMAVTNLISGATTGDEEGDSGNE